MINILHHFPFVYILSAQQLTVFNKWTSLKHNLYNVKRLARLNYFWSFEFLIRNYYTNYGWNYNICYWIKMNNNGPKWMKVDQNRPKWTKSGPKQTNQGPINNKLRTNRGPIEDLKRTNPGPINNQLRTNRGPIKDQSRTNRGPINDQSRTK